MFAVAAVKYGGHCAPLIKVLSAFLTIASASASIYIFKELLIFEPERAYHPTRLLLKDLKRVVAEGEEHRKQFNADLDQIFKLDK